MTTFTLPTTSGAFGPISGCVEHFLSCISGCMVQWTLPSKKKNLLEMDQSESVADRP